jgi:hypothetical protein
LGHSLPMRLVPRLARCSSPAWGAIENINREQCHSNLVRAVTPPANCPARRTKLPWRSRNAFDLQVVLDTLTDGATKGLPDQSRFPKDPDELIDATPMHPPQAPAEASVQREEAPPELDGLPHSLQPSPEGLARGSMVPSKSGQTRLRDTGREAMTAGFICRYTRFPHAANQLKFLEYLSKCGWSRPSQPVWFLRSIVRKCGKCPHSPPLTPSLCPRTARECVIPAACLRRLFLASRFLMGAAFSFSTKAKRGALVGPVERYSLQQ